LWIDSPHDRNEYERATARVAGLVGIPSGEVIADVTARLRGTEWLAGWSHRHYGTLISATADVAGATPFLLLAGDPGTGKSVLAHQLPPIIAHRLGSPVLFIQLNDKLRGTGIQGRAGTGVVTVIQEIGWLADRQRVPTVVFLDEAESVASSRRSVDGSSGSAENVAVTDALIVGLDQVFARGDARLVFVMATNLTAQVDSAVLRRATIYQFDRPSAVDRRQILLRCLGEVVDPVVLDSVNQLLDRPGLPLTAADVLNQVVGRAIREAATADRPIDLSRLADLARRAVPTAPVAAT
jgi:AAA+ superfamily predicted ATPase